MLELRQVESADGGLVWLGIDPANEQFGYAGVDRADNPCPIDSAAGFYRYAQHVIEGRAKYLRRREFFDRGMLVQLGLVAAAVQRRYPHRPYTVKIRVRGLDLEAAPAEWQPPS